MEIFIAFCSFFVLVGIYANNPSSFKNFFNAKVIYHTKISKSSFDSLNRLLSDKFSYYKTLTPQGKAKFISRLIKIRHTKSFEGRGGFNLSEEQKALISASMVQLSYGLKGYNFENIDKIVVFPEQFYSPMFQQDVKGLTSHEGFVAISWKDFEQGYLIEDDCYNLGLHEMAHALKLDAIVDGGFDSGFVSELRRFQQVGIGEYASIKDGYTSVLRDYAGTNMQEFFAVCVENFFESPEQFKNSLPSLYKQLCVLLNQNPLNVNEDYKLGNSLNNIEEDVIVSKKKEISNAGYNIRIIGGAILIFGLLYILDEATGLPVFRSALLIGAVWLLVKIKAY